MAFILYELTFPNGKKYVGQTVRSMDIRFRQHRSSAETGSPLAVHCAWRKHGEPSVAVLGEYDDADTLHAAEVKAIADRGTLSPHGYNLGFGGETAPSKNPDVAKKISERTKGRKAPMTGEERSVVTAALWQTDEYRKAQTDAQKARWADADAKAAQSQRLKAAWAKRKAEGWQMPEETKAKMRKREFSAETRAKMSAAAKARKRVSVSDETRAKLSGRTKAAWQDKELSERRVSAIKATAAIKWPKVGAE